MIRLATPRLFSSPPYTIIREYLPNQLVQTKESKSPAMLRPLFPRCGSVLRAAARRPLLNTWQTTQRSYSIKAKAASDTKQQPLDASKLTVEKTTHQKSLMKPEDLVFGRTFTGTLPPPPLFNKKPPTNNASHTTATPGTTTTWADELRIWAGQHAA